MNITNLKPNNTLGTRLMPPGVAWAGSASARGCQPNEKSRDHLSRKGRRGMKPQWLMAFVGLVSLLLALGCSTLSPGGSRTLKQTDADVSWAMTRFRNGVAAGAVTLGEQEQVNSAYASYQAAYRDALQAAHNNRNSPAPDNVKSLATQVIGAVAAIPF